MRLSFSIDLYTFMALISCCIFKPECLCNLFKIIPNKISTSILTKLSAFLFLIFVFKTWFEPIVSHFSKTKLDTIYKLFLKQNMSRAAALKNFIECDPEQSTDLEVRSKTFYLFYVQVEVTFAFIFTIRI